MVENSLTDRVQRLEELNAHQEHLLQQLSDVLIQVRAEHDELTRLVKQQLDRFELRLARESFDVNADEKPPHY